MAYFCGSIAHPRFSLPTPRAVIYLAPKTLPFKIQLYVREHIYLCFPSPVGQKCSYHGDGTGAPAILYRDITMDHGKGNICSPNPQPPYRGLPNPNRNIVMTQNLTWEKISGSAVQVTPLERSHNGPFTVHGRPAGREPAQYYKLMTLE